MTAHARSFATTYDYADHDELVARGELLVPGRARHQALRAEAVQLVRVLRTAWQGTPLVLSSMTGGRHPDVVALACIRLCFPRRRRPPVVLMGEMWQPDPGPRGLLQRVLVRLADPVVTRYVVFSSEETAWFPDQWGVDPAKVRLVPYFASVTEADACAHSPTPTDRMPAGRPLVFAGGTSKRDYDPLVAAARELPEVRFVLATDQLDGRADLPPNVEAGRVSHAQFVALLAHADAVVVALQRGLRRAAGQQTYLNAMLLGRPVVVSDAPAVHDHLEPDRTGIVVDGSAGGYARALRWVLDPANAGAVAAMTAGARREVEERFTYRRHVDGMLAVLDEAIAQHERSARVPDADAPLRVTMVEFSPSAGLFQFAFQLGEALARAGVEVELVTGPDPELSTRQPGMRVTSILPTWHPAAGGPTRGVHRILRRGVRGLAHLRAWGVLARHLRRTRPDVVQWSNWRFALDAVVVRLLKASPGAPVMVDLAHTPRPWDMRRGADGVHRSGVVLDSALGAAYRSMDAVFVLGERSRVELLEHYPGIRRVEVIPHGDESIYADADVPTADATPPRALFFGKWLRYKNLDLLLDAFAIVRTRLPEAQLAIVGAVGKDVDAGAIATRAAAIGNVELQPGYVAIDDVPAVFASARVVVAPYRAANQSGVVHIAQTLARPAIVTDVGDLAAAVADGETGLVVAPDDAVALADALVRVLADPAEAARLGGAAARRVAAEASWADVAARVLRCYQALAGREEEADEEDQEDQEA